MKRTMSIMHDPKHKAWWVVAKDGWHVQQFQSPREARHFKRMWHLYMTTESGFYHLDIPCPPKRVECPCCERTVFNVHTWRTNTRFTDDSKNYMYCCYECICENDSLRHDDWNEYYRAAYGYFYFNPFKPRSRKDYVK